MAERPKAADFQNALAYRAAEVLWRTALLDGEMPEDRAIIEALPGALEALTKRYIDAVNRMVRPAPIILEAPQEKTDG
jgi:hypothetical protein